MVEHRSPKPGVGSSSLSSRANIIEMKKVIAYIKESYDELVHKVSWPTYSDVYKRQERDYQKCDSRTICAAGMNAHISKPMIRCLSEAAMLYMPQIIDRQIFH